MSLQVKTHFQPDAEEHSLENLDDDIVGSPPIYQQRPVSMLPTTSGLLLNGNDSATPSATPGASGGSANRFPLTNEEVARARQLEKSLGEDSKVGSPRVQQSGQHGGFGGNGPRRGDGRGDNATGPAGKRMSSRSQRGEHQGNEWSTGRGVQGGEIGVADGGDLPTPAISPGEEEKQVVEPGMRRQSRREEEDQVVMSATSFPGQMWNPYDGTGW